MKRKTFGFINFYNGALECSVIALENGAIGMMGDCFRFESDLFYHLVIDCLIFWKDYTINVEIVETEKMPHVDTVF